MDKKNPLSELIQECMAKAREMADTNTIVGQPISTPDGVTLIPISKVSFGFGSGASDLGAVMRIFREKLSRGRKGARRGAPHRGEVYS